MSEQAGFPGLRDTPGVDPRRLLRVITRVTIGDVRQHSKIRIAIMSKPDSSSFKAKLIGRVVVVKVSLFSRAFRGAITATDETGFCLVSEDMIAALRETTGSAMADMDNPSVYLPFSALEWLITSEPKAAAASA